MKLDVTLVSNASESELELIKNDLAKFCPVSTVIRAAGTTIEEDWQVINP